MEQCIDYDTLLAARSRPQLTAPLLEVAFKTQGSVTLTLGPDGVTLGCVPGGAEPGPCLQGLWAHGYAVPEVSHVGACLLLPLLFRARQIVLPHHAIYSVGREERSLADFFMRNVYLSALFGGRPRYVADSETWPDALSARSGELGRRYLWLLRAGTPEPWLSRRNARELLVAATQLPLLKFDSDLLRVGMDQIRQSLREVGESPRHALRADFMSLRQSLMPLYGS